MEKFHSKRIIISLGLVEMLFLSFLFYLYSFLQRLVYIHVHVYMLYQEHINEKTKAWSIEHTHK